MKEDQAWVNMRKYYQRAWENINMTVPFCLNYSQLKRTTAAFLPSPRSDQLPSPLKMTTTTVRQIFQRLIPDVSKVTGLSEFKNILRRPYEVRIVIAAVLAAAADAVLIAHHLQKLGAHLVTARPVEELAWRQET